MTPPFAEIRDSLPAFTLVFSRIAAIVALLPGIGESVSPSSAKIGLAGCLTLLLMPSIDGTLPVHAADTPAFALVLVSEVVTGLWFGLIVKLVVFALPIAGQVIGYLVGLSSVLQPDPEIGSQTGALGRLFDLVAPVFILASGLYRFPLQALAGLFVLVPAGSVLPSADSLEVVVQHVTTVFELAIQLASPFIVASVVWQIAMGQMARVVGRMQIYFISMPGQILGGLAIVALTAGSIAAAWHSKAQTLMLALPGTH